MAGPTIAKAEVQVDLDGKRLVAEARVLGEEAGRAAGEAHSDAFDKRAGEGLDDFGKEAERDLREHGRRSGDGFGVELENALAPHIKEAGRDLTAVFQEPGGAMRTFRGDLEDLVGGVDDFGGAVKGTGGDVDDMVKHVERAHDPLSTLDDYLTRLGVTTSHEVESGVSAAARAFDGLGQDIEGAGAKANRSNGFFSALFGPFTRGTGKAVDDAGRFFGIFAGEVERAGAEAGKSQGSIGNLLKGLSNFDPGDDLGALLALLIAFLPQLATLAGAAGGGLLILSGAATAAALGIGGIVLGFSNILKPLNTLPDAVRPAAKAIQDLVGGFEDVNGKLKYFPGAITGIREALQIPLFAGLAGEINELRTNLLPGLETDFGGLGRTLNGVLKGMLDDLNSSGFKSTLSGIFKGAEPSITDLGNTARNVFGIIGQLLLDVLPDVNQFTGGIADATGNFLKFLKSPEGKTAVHDFLEDAKKVLKEVGDDLVIVGGAFGKLITPRNVETTIGQLKSLASAVQDLVKFADRISPLTDALVGAIGAISDFAAGVGKALDELAGAFDEMLLDAQFAFTGILKAVGELASGIGSNFAAIGKAITQAASGDFVGAAKTIAGAVENTKASVARLGEDIALSVGNATAAFNTLPKSAQTQLEAMAAQFGIKASAVKDFGGTVSQMALRAGVDIGSLATAKGWADLQAKTGISNSELQRLRDQFTDTSTKGAAALAGLSASAKGSLDGLVGKLGATGTSSRNDFEKVLSQAASDSGKSLRDLANASSLPDLVQKLAGAGSNAKSKFANEIIAAASESGQSIDKLPPKLQALINKYGDIPGSKNTKVTIDDQASGTVSAIQQRINGIYGKSVTVTVNYATGSGSNKFTGTGGLAEGGIVGLNSIVAGHPRMLAAGGLLNQPTFLAGGAAIAGEAGLEAVVPLTRPLYEVDPSVRSLAAYAQGLSSVTTKAKGDTYFSQGAVQVITPAEDPAIVASQVLDRLVPQL